MNRPGPTSGEPLRGVRVLDLSKGSAGPVASMLLADYGAEVVQIEPPGGDPFSALPPEVVWGRGKQRTTIDLASDSGRSAFMSLVGQSDVVLDSFSPGGAERLGVDYASLQRANPRVVSCSITGYGTRGAIAERPGYDILVQARTGFQFEQPGLRPGPIFVLSPLPSYGAGLLAAVGISAALFEREASGRGQRVETSLLQGVLIWTAIPWSRVGTPTPAYYHTYRSECRDISPTPCYEAGDGQWFHPMPEVVPALVEELGAEAGVVPPGSGDCDAVRAHQAAVQRLFLERPRDHWVELFSTKDLRAQPVLSLEEAFAHPQVVENDIVVDREVPGAGTVRQFGRPYRLNRTRPSDGKDDQPGPGSSPAAPRSSNGPLAGVRVLDFGLALAGPYGPMMLADLGADVIRVENARGRRPAGGAARPAAALAQSAAGVPAAALTQTWVACQRGKRSISLDLKQPEGLEIARALIAQADVIHHNMRPGAAERLGIGFEDAKRLKPDIVYCHVSGFGPTGPLATAPGCDQMAQALLGLEHEQGATPAGGHPTWHRLGVSDHAAAVISVLGVTQALRMRAQGPQLVETNLLNAAGLLMSHMFSAGSGAVRPWRSDLAQTGVGPMYRLYQTGAGWIAIACLRDKHRAALLEVTGVEAGDDGELAAALEKVFATRAAEEWFAALDAKGVPCEVCSDSFNLGWFDDPDLRAEELVTDYPVPHPVLGRVEHAGRLWRFSASSPAIERPPVVPGQHTREVLAELGFEADRIDALLERGVVVEAGP
ncbi:MAG: CoA transferase [Acidimicrobiales bacterium]|nr:CoA transferase [Acidimicrobiales bacterium]